MWSWTDVGEVAHDLANHPTYGDSSAIAAAALARIEIAAEELLGRQPGPSAPFAGQIDWWHPVVVRLVQDTLNAGISAGRGELGWSAADVLLRIAADDQLQVERGSSLVVVDEGSGSAADRLLYELADQQWGSETTTLRPGTTEDLRRIVDARNAVVDLMGALGTDALSYVRHYGIQVSAEISASTDLAIPGFTLISEELLDRREVLAASVFHESLHSKKALINLAFGGAAGSDRDDDCLFIAWHATRDPWWSPGRALDALHVYVHMSVYEARRWVRLRRDDDARRQLHRNIFRARYLSSLLGRATEHLSTVDRGMLEWLDGLVPPPLDLTAEGADWLAFAEHDIGAIRTSER